MRESDCRPLIGAALLIFCVSACPKATIAQTAGDLAARLHAAAKDSSIDTDGMFQRLIEHDAINTTVTVNFRFGPG